MISFFRRHRRNTSFFLLFFSLSVLLAFSRPVRASSHRHEDIPAEGKDLTSGAELPEEKKKLTVMIYLCGSNLESSGGAATADLYEIVHSGVNRKEVNVILAAGGSKEWKNTFSPDETAIYKLGNGTDWQQKKLLFDDETKGIPANMGNSSTLLEFLDYSWEYAPADEYALIFWDHGGGPLRGVCWDMLWAGNNLDMNEVCEALSRSPFGRNKLAWVGFDACLMSSIETAHLMAPYASCMIASEETEPAHGWNYAFLKGIEEDTDSSVTGTRIVDSFFEGSASSDAGLTLSCIDLEVLPETEKKMSVFFEQLSGILNEQTFSALSNSRHRTREFGRAEEDDQQMDLVDLTDLVRHYASYAPDESRDLISSIEKLIIHNRSSIPNCSGVSVYHPYYNKLLYEKAWAQEYESIGLSDGYSNYMENFAGIWMDSSLGKWENLSEIHASAESGTTQTLSYHLTENQLEHFASAHLLILEEIGTEDLPSERGYSQVYVSDPVEPDENGVLNASYGGQSLYVVGENDEILSGPINYAVKDDGHLLIYVNYFRKGDSEESHVAFTAFECEPAPPGEDLSVLEQYVYDENTGTWSNRLTISQNEYDDIIFLRDYRKITYDGDTLLSYRDWEDSDWRGGFEDALPLTFHFRFYNSMLSDTKLSACFEIMDTQSNVHGTELLPLDNPGETSLILKENTVISENLRCELEGRMVNTELEKYIELTCGVTNLTDHKQSLTGYVVLNKERVVWANEGSLSITLEPGESFSNVLTIHETALSDLGSISEIRFLIKCKQYPNEDEAAGGWPDPVMEELAFVPVNLDVSPIAAHYADAPVLASIEDRGVHFTLVDAKEDPTGKITGILYARNESGIDSEYRINMLSVNGMMINPFMTLGANKLYLPDGTDGYFIFIGDNEQELSHSYGNVDGFHHMKASDVLGTAGIRDISSLILIDSFNMEDPFENEENPVKICFDLTEPLPYEKKTEEVPPVQQLLFEAGGISVYGESVMLADSSVILRLILENHSDKDEVLQFYGWDYNELEDSYPSPKKFLVPSGMKRRVYLENTCSAELKDEKISRIRFCCRNKYSETPFIFRIGFSLPEPYSPEDSHGQIFPFPDEGILTENLSVEPSTDPFFTSDIACPDNLKDYIKELSFTLPDTITEEEKAAVTDVYAGIMRDFPDHSLFMAIDGSKTYTDPVYQPLAWAALSEDSSESGSYSGCFSGLLCVSEKNPRKNFRLEKNEPSETPDGLYSLAEILALHPLDSLDPNGSAWLNLKASMEIRLSYTVEGGGTAVLTDFHLEDSSSENMASWPINYFEKMTSYDGGVYYKKQEDGSLTSGVYVRSLEELDLPLEGETISLKMIPVTEYDPNIILLYAVYFEDGTVRYYEGGSY